MEIVHLKWLFTVLLLLELHKTNVTGKLNDKTYSGVLHNVKRYTISSNADINIDYANTPTNNPYRVNAWSASAEINYPVIVVVRQQRRVLSWQIPLVVEKNKTIYEYSNTSRTLCFDHPDIVKNIYNGHLQAAAAKNFSITLSTFSKRPIEVFVLVTEVKDFFIKDLSEITTKVSPSEPAYYSYSFKDEKEISTTFINITSPDDICLTASVQNRICPVQDLAAEISYQGKYETILKQGGMIISRDLFPNGFFLVFVSNVNNDGCTPKEHDPNIRPRGRSLESSRNRETQVSFHIERGLTRSAYVKAILITTFTNIGVSSLCLIIALMFFYFGTYNRNKDNCEVTNPIMMRNGNDLGNGNIETLDLDQSDFHVSIFSKKPERNNKKSNNFFWHITNIAIFYGIPVTQLMISYQKAVHQTGNHDICYHNYLCSHPLYFTDFNHIFSNIGYIFFGFLFIGIVSFRNIKVTNKKHTGIPTHYGLFYAMGCALIFEGIFSANYHICPTQENFQFDTSFMYIMAALIIVKLYQNRHPDINASAYATFGVLGIHIFIAMVGILITSKIVMYVFVILDILLCFYVSIKVYFFSTVKKGLKKAIDDFVDGGQSSILHKIRPKRKVAFFCLLLANLVNWAIAISGIILYPETIDFGTYLLGILMMNGLLYLLFYIIMKLAHKEKICAEAWTYLVISVVLWGVSAYFFVTVATESSLSPAESRQYNRECIVLRFFDTHDIWHLLSAPALFFSFMALLTIDDNLILTPQNEIDAF